MAADNGTRSVLGDFWPQLIAKYGLATALTIILLYYLAFYIVEPMRVDQRAFMNSVIKTNEINAATHSAAASSMAQMTRVQETQSATLSTLVEQQKQTTGILQQIRDDQRRGVWNEAKRP